VFKEPQEAKDNYIKRLIGLPGETIEIINGDIYVGHNGETEPAKLTIARKPEHLQGNLWQLVYDNDFYPIDEGMAPAMPQPGEFRRNAPWVNPWHPPEGWGDGSAWTRGVVMKYAGTGASSLEFQMRPGYGANTLGYNDDVVEWQSSTIFPVGDMRLDTTWRPAKEGEMVALTVGRLNNRFLAKWEGGTLELMKYDVRTSGWNTVEKAAVAASKAGQAYHLAMSNVDRAVYVYVDGSLVLTHETPWTAADALEDLRDFPPSLQRPDVLVKIDVSGPGELSHLKLMRDLYYTQSDPRATMMRTANQGNPLVLGADEFFALGDNSRESADGRVWPAVFPALDDLGTRPGIVPRRYLLGKAFFVYWPAGYRPTSNENVPLLKDLPLVPNTGEMRMIR
jgi:hypothetical protein